MRDADLCFRGRWVRVPAWALPLLWAVIVALVIPYVLWYRLTGRELWGMRLRCQHDRPVGDCARCDAASGKGRRVEVWA